MGGKRGAAFVIESLNRVQPRHAAINLRLEQWARWSRVGPPRGAVTPMFRQYRSTHQYDDEPYIAQPVNTQECIACQFAVSTLPARIRTAINWHYARPWIPVSVVRRELGVTREGLLTFLDNGRDMVTNRLRRN
jgi:hypothetical protein